MSSERQVSTGTAAAIVIVAVIVILAVGWYFMNRRGRPSTQAPTGPRIQIGSEGKMGKATQPAPSTP